MFVSNYHLKRDYWNLYALQILILNLVSCNCSLPFALPFWWDQKLCWRLHCSIRHFPFCLNAFSSLSWASLFCSILAMYLLLQSLRRFLASYRHHALLWEYLPYSCQHRSWRLHHYLSQYFVYWVSDWSLFHHQESLLPIAGILGFETNRRSSCLKRTCSASCSWC